MNRNPAEVDRGNAEGLRDIDPADIPTPDHHIGVPAAPSTMPPEPPVVPSDAEVASFWMQNKAVIILVAGAALIAVFVIANM